MVSNIHGKSYYSSKLNSENDLLNFFLYGSYEVQYGDFQMFSSDTNKTNDKIPIYDLINNDKNNKSRCMFEETYMINVSVKQPNRIQREKQVNVCIKKTPSNIDEDVRRNDIDSSTTDDNIESNYIYNWDINQHNKIKSRKIRTMKKENFLTDIQDDEKLFYYLNYLETNHSRKPLISNNKSRTKQISIIDLEQLCRSLTNDDLQDELIQKKIFELKTLINHRHKKK